MAKEQNKKKGCGKSIINGFDIYGQRVSLTFQKKASFSTCFGSFLTLVTMSLMISFTVQRCMKLVSKSDPFFTMLSLAADDDYVDVGNLKYMFAV